MNDGNRGMSNAQHPFEWRFIYNPRFWLTWVGLAILWLSSLLPYRLLQVLGKGLGILIWAFGPERRRITRTNLRLCFPDLPQHELRRLVLHSFYSVGMAVFESALTWWGSDRKFLSLMHTEGFEHVSAALQQGKGVILLGGHYATLEVGGRIMAQQFENLRPTYKSARDPLFNWVMIRMRIRRNGGIINSNNMREVIRALKQNMLIWYAPDQDFGMERSVFAPFMGVSTATLTFTSRLAKASGSVVLPWYCERLPDGQGYTVRIEAPLSNFPSGDDVTDATIVNQIIEQQVRRTPDQYLWGHRRFKTRPPGEPMVYEPRRDSALQRYSLALAVLALPMLLYTIWQAYKYRDLKYLRERLGFGRYPSAPRCIWLHAASVGEVNAIIPLIKLLKQQHPQYSLLMTCNTPSGWRTAKNQLPEDIGIHYLPIDWQFAVKKFIDTIKPLHGLITETELWPNLYLHCGYRGIPLVLINARLSQRVERASRWLRILYCHCINHTLAILARSQLDKQRFLLVCAKEERISVLGNIKFAITASTDHTPAKVGRSYILAASTRDAEEALILEQFLQNAPATKLLVIVPRHPKRAATIIKQLRQQQVEIAVRSKKEAITASTRVYLADTFGELQNFMAGAEFVIMGGSFLPFGGQNILEAANNGKAVIFGPHMDNFLDEAKLFLQQQAGIQVQSLSELGACIARLCVDTAFSAQMGSNGLALINAQRDIAQRYLTQLQKLLSL